MAAITTHGVRRFLVSGELPAGCSHVKKARRRFLKELEAAVIARHEEIDITSATLIDTACFNEVAARLYFSYMAGDETGALPIEQRMAILREVRAHKTNRDKAVKDLDLRSGAKSDLDRFYNEPEPSEHGSDDK